MAAVLAHLHDCDPLNSCWPLLTAEGASSHPRWLELGVMVLEAAAKLGKATRHEARFKEAAEQLLQHVRLAVRVPQLAEWEVWQPDAAAEQVGGFGWVVSLRWDWHMFVKHERCQRRFVFCHP